MRQHKYFSIFLFLFLYGFFYFGNKFFTGITVPGGLYSPWLDEHLNYVRVYRNFLLHTSAFFIRLFGFSTDIGPYRVGINGGAGVQLIYACLGFAIFSFWWAMIIAFPQTIRNKMLFLFGGTAIVIALNIIRITGVAIIFKSEWGRAHRSFDHHMVFNIIVYGVLFYMLYRWFNLTDRSDSRELEK